MSADTEISNEELVAYADGQLDDSGIARVEEALQVHPSLQIRIDNYKKSGSILKSALSVDGLKTPDHILARFDAIEESSKKPMEAEKRPSFLESFYSFFQLRYAVPTCAAFAFGILISPSLFPPSPITFKGEGVSSDQIVVRGLTNETLNSQPDLISGSLIDLEGYLNVRVIQNENGIVNGGLIREGVPFSVILLAPIGGRATIRELVNGVETDILDTQDIAAGRYLTFASMRVDDQDSISLRVTLLDTDIEVSLTLNFTVEN